MLSLAVEVQDQLPVLQRLHIAWWSPEGDSATDATTWENVVDQLRSKGIIAAHFKYLPG